MRVQAPPKRPAIMGETPQKRARLLAYRAANLAALRADARAELGPDASNTEVRNKIMALARQRQGSADSSNVSPAARRHPEAPPAPAPEPAAAPDLAPPAPEDAPALDRTVERTTCHKKNAQPSLAYVEGVKGGGG